MKKDKKYINIKISFLLALFIGLFLNFSYSSASTLSEIGEKCTNMSSCSSSQIRYDINGKLCCIDRDCTKYQAECSSSASCSSGYYPSRNSKNIVNNECKVEFLSDSARCCFKDVCGANNGQCTSQGSVEPGTACTKLGSGYEYFESGDYGCKAKINDAYAICCIKTVVSYSCTGTRPNGTTEKACPNDEIGLTESLAWEKVGDSPDKCTDRKCEYYTVSQQDTSCDDIGGTCKDNCSGEWVNSEIGKSQCRTQSCCVKKSDQCEGKPDNTACTTTEGKPGTCKNNTCIPSEKDSCVGKEDGASCTTTEGKTGICKDEKCVATNNKCNGQCLSVCGGEYPIPNPNGDSDCDDLSICCEKSSTSGKCGPNDKYTCVDKNDDCNDHKESYDSDCGAGKICCDSSGSTGNYCPEYEEGLSGGFLLFKGSLVPCGRSCDDKGTDYDETKTCTLCHFIILFKRIYDLLFSLLIIVSLVMITIGGVVYIISTGNPGLMGVAKNLIIKTLTGFGLFLLSWLLVFTVLKFISANTSVLNDGKSWNDFTCDTESKFDTSGINPGTKYALSADPDLVGFAGEEDMGKKVPIKVYYSEKNSAIKIDKNLIAGATRKDVTAESSFFTNNEDIAFVDTEIYEGCTKETPCIIGGSGYKNVFDNTDIEEAKITVKYKEYTTFVDVLYCKHGCDE